MQFTNSSVAFPVLSGSGPQVQSVPVNVGTPVTQAVAILTGFTVEYSNGNDHHLGSLQVQVSVANLSGSTVSVQVTYGLRDWSGNWDDAYDGQIFFTIVSQ
jgi:hypothetical protein